MNIDMQTSSEELEDIYRHIEEMRMRNRELDELMEFLNKLARTKAKRYIIRSYLGSDTLAPT